MIIIFSQIAFISIITVFKLVVFKFLQCSLTSQTFRHYTNIGLAILLMLKSFNFHVEPDIALSLIGYCIVNNKVYLIIIQMRNVLRRVNVDKVQRTRERIR